MYEFTCEEMIYLCKGMKEDKLLGGRITHYFPQYETETLYNDYLRITKEYPESFWEDLGLPHYERALKNLAMFWKGYFTAKEGQRHE